jgi:15-cis-phytoene synthase
MVGSNLSLRHSSIEARPAKPAWCSTTKFNDQIQYPTMHSQKGRDMYTNNEQPLRFPALAGAGQFCSPPTVAIERCRAITQAHSSTFYLGSRFFPLHQRQAVWAVYAACRIGDDIADEDCTPSAPIRLEQWRASIEAALEGQLVPASSEFYAMSQALAWAAAEFPLSYAPFGELYLGLKMDLDAVQYQSLEDLLLYCRRVAGTVGWMISPISGYSGGDATLDQALKLGIAMQITNVLRDVGEDLGRNRVYLPANLLAAYGLCQQDLRVGHLAQNSKGQIDTRYIALMQELTTLARQYYVEGWAGIPQLHGPARFAVALAAASYEGILGALERQGWNNFSQRAHLSGPRKLALIPGVLLRLRSGTRRLA